jgi:hypothetical protein
MSDNRAAAMRWNTRRGGGAAYYLRVGEQAARAKLTLRAIAKNPHLTEQVITIGLKSKRRSR